jgi:mRNA-degrading endonuclease HigB of HigAB toxin-antitoxin module
MRSLRWTKEHPVIAAQLLRWLGIMERLTECHSFNELRGVFNSVDRVITRKENAVCVFDLGHGKNSYRLIAAVHFQYADRVCPQTSHPR